DSPMPLVWDEDVADAVILAMNQRARGAFILATEDGPSPLESGFKRFPLPRAVIHGLSAAVSRIQRARGKPTHDPVWSKGLRGVTSASPSERAKKELGWRPSCATDVDVLRRFLADAPRRLDPRLRVFFGFAAAASRRRVPEEHRHISARIHLDLTGPNGGDLGLVLDEGRLSVSTRPPRPPTSVVRLPASTLRRLLARRADLRTLPLTRQRHAQGEPAG